MITYDLFYVTKQRKTQFLSIPLPVICTSSSQVADHILAALREKVPNVMSLCHTKRRPFFWYDTDFSELKKKQFLKIFQIFE